MKHRFLLALLMCTLIGVVACKKRKPIDEPLTYSQADEVFKDYITAYTSGVISKASPIRIRFASDIVLGGEIGEPAPADLITFDPAIEGEMKWEDSRTLRFEPKEWMDTRQLYQASLNVKSIYPEVPKTAEFFRFEFKIIEQEFNVDIRGLREQEINDFDKMRLTGTVYTADVATPEEMQKILAATQGDNADIEIKWTHSTDNKRHSFEVMNIQRQTTDSQLALSWATDALGIEETKKDTTLDVPAYEFKVIGAKVIQEDNEDPYVLVQFSTPLQQVQDLSGLIKIKDSNLNMDYMIDGSELRVYPQGNLQGDRVVSISSGIRNIKGDIVGLSDWDVFFESVKPQVRLLGNGVIIPQSKGLYFPFEAVNLRAVDVEIFKIYEDNVQQFLQRTDLDGNNNLAYVGRIVKQKRILLQELKPIADLGQWTRYYLNLEELVEQEAGAIYQVRIAFRKDYSAYTCNGEALNEDIELKTTEPRYKTDDDGEYTSFFDTYYYWNYNYDNRDDPCTDDYYNNRRFIQRNVLASNIGIVAKRGSNREIFVAVTDLITTQPMLGATVEIFDYQQQSIAKVSTGKDGTARIKADISHRPFMLVASHKKQKGYLKMNEGSSLSLSRFEVSGQRNYKGLKGKIYGERGVWRPGDSLYLSFVLEDRQHQLPATHPVTFELFDPRGQLRQTRTVSEHLKGIYSFHTATESSAPTGNWHLEAHVGGATFSETLKIETVKPNRLKIDFDLGRDKLVSVDKNFEADLNVKWLHGAPARDIRTEIDVNLSASNTKFKGFDDYEFDDPARNYYDSEPFKLFNGVVNEDGYAKVNGKLAPASAPSGFMRASFTIRAFEKGGDASIDNFSLPYSPYGVYAGIEMPKDRWGSNRMDVNETNKVELVAVDEAGKAAPNRKLSIGLYRLQWRWWWDSQGEVTQFNSTQHSQAMETKTVTTGENGKVQWSVKPNEWGRYMVRVCDEETGHCSGDFFYAGTPWDDNKFNDKQAASMLAFSANKEAYNVGEKVKLDIPTGKTGRALVTLENGTSVLKHYWVDVKESESGVQTFEFEAEPEMSPTIYAHVTLLQPHAQAQNDLPIRSYGVIPIRVEDPDTRLDPVLEMADVLAPNTSVKVKVNENNGKPMAYTIAMVDEGLLDLTRFKTPNLWDHFYAKEALGVQSWDMYKYVLGAYGVELDRVLSIGGGAGNDADDIKKANRFKPVVQFLGPFYLEGGKSATHTLNMPNYIGSVRTMIVASNDGAYGKADKATPVRKPLMCLATLPRVLSPTEEVALPVTVFAMEEQIKEVELEVIANELIEVKGSAKKKMTFAKIGEQMETFDLRVKEGLGIATVKVIARSGKEESVYNVELDVRNPNQRQTKVIDVVVDAGKEWNSEFVPVGLKGTNSGILEVSSIPPINLGNRLEYLIRYPHGCIEQTTSSVFPQLFVGNLLDLDNQRKKDIEKNIKAGIKQISGFQTNLGGFSYWPGGGEASEWGSNYAGHFLVEAKNKGYSIPKNILANWQKYQKSNAKAWKAKTIANSPYTNRNEVLMQAYRLYTLALADAAELGAMNRMLEMKSLPITAKWRLASAYALVGKKEVAARIVNNLSTEVKPYTELSYSYGSDLRDQGMILEALTLIGMKEKAALLVRQISEKLSSGNWYSTQTTAYSLLAVAKFAGGQKLNDQLNYAYQLGAGAGQKGTLQGKPIAQYTIEVDQMSKYSVAFKNNSKSMLFVRLILDGKPLIGKETEQANDINMEVKYETLAGKEIDPVKMQQGVDFVAIVKLTNPGTRGKYDEMVLTQVFPSGWEIVNTRMTGAFSNSLSDYMDYQDFRDDRVHTYFDLDASKSVTYKIYLNAAYKGRFYLPNVSCEAMYDHTINASKPGKWVEVVPAGGRSL